MMQTVHSGPIKNAVKNYCRQFVKSIKAGKSNQEPFFSSLPPLPTYSALVKYHMLNSVQCSEAIMAGSVHETEEGSAIEIGCDGDSLTVNGIKMVMKKDIVTTNGVIHLIDRVLIPDSGRTGFYFYLSVLVFCHHLHVISFIHFSQGRDGADGSLPGHFW